MDITNIDTRIFDEMVTDHINGMYESQYMDEKKENTSKCTKGLFGNHKWITEKRISGAGKIFVYKLDPPECELCGTKKYY